MPTFQAIPDVPLEGLNQALYSLLSAMKENLEIMMGVRQSGVKAVMSDAVTTLIADNITQVRRSAQGAYTHYTSFSTMDVVSVTDYVKLLDDVQQVINELVLLQRQVNDLITRMQT